MLCLCTLALLLLDTEAKGSLRSSPAADKDSSTINDSDIFAADVAVKSAGVRLSCYNKKYNQYHNVGDTYPCEELTPNQVRRDLVGKLCKCTDLQNGEFKWRADGVVDDADVNAMFLGNIVGHAKMLCSIVEAIDCWQEKDLKKTFPFLPFSEEEQATEEIKEETIGIKMADGSTKFAAKADVIDTVKKVCGVINGGVSELPNLIPGLIDGVTGGLFGKLPGIPDLLRKLVDKIGGDDGDGGLLDKIGDLFSGIFMVSVNGQGFDTATAPFSSGIRVFDAPDIQERR